MPDSDTPFVIETPRLYITHWDPASQKHCAFIVRLFACESFQQFLGNRGIKTEEDARAYITNRMVAHYEKHGFGGMLVSLKPSDASNPCTSSDLERSEPLGGSSLMIHGEHTLPDVGFGFLDEAQGKGYATEAARALVDYAKTTLGFPHVLAFCHPENAQSRKAIERLGFTSLGVHEIKAFPEHGTMVWASPGVRDFEELKTYNVY
ncbi:including n-acetylases of ribosomal protein [Exidia glandulosa HHB12029]|uniref:Including n-acetylases of ribosomal protein n=1 Tax=Exidia glandulosa HHB12029 TaxID=1314781 RepID=A0A165L6W0_EXIGL|nr:including n-acetylases of ribosomal protein [Exidia glandulosa HHB12029]